MKLRPTIVFCSANGYDKNGIEVSFFHGTLKGDELKDIDKYILNGMSKANSKVKTIHIICATPLEFDSEEIR